MNSLKCCFRCVVSMSMIVCMRRVFDSIVFNSLSWLVSVRCFLSVWLSWTCTCRHFSFRIFGKMFDFSFAVLKHSFPKKCYHFQFHQYDSPNRFAGIICESLIYAYFKNHSLIYCLLGSSSVYISLSFNVNFKLNNLIYLIKIINLKLNKQFLI